MKDPAAFNFDGDYGREYEDLASTGNTGNNELLVATLAHLQQRQPEEARVLIVGCGTGREIKVFAPGAPRWHFDAVDPAIEMIRWTDQLARSIGVENRVTLHHAFTHELDLSYRFDGATIINVMHFMPDDGNKDRLIESVVERVRPGGSVMLFDLHGDQNQEYFQLFFDAWISYMDLRGYTGQKKERLLNRLAAGIAYVSEERVLEICARAGLKLIRRYWGGLLYTAWLFERQ
ncbi:MAG: class I SAM-dependent methyltransferase [Bacteroidota bacterium]|nr:class I SAM-dependent methyltransferase [Bacteroidota bacterium]